VRVVVLADTHIRDGSTSGLSAAAWAHVRAADVILHAGDVVGAAFLGELRSVAPVHAVLGNNDAALAGRLPETLIVDLHGVPVAMVHDSGPRAGREARMQRRFPGARVVVFGHSHVPWNRTGLGGQLLFNPGSPTQRRAQPHRTLGLLEIGPGGVQAEIAVVD
jgi:uncharacterized protein